MGTGVHTSLHGSVGILDHATVGRHWGMAPEKTGVYMPLRVDAGTRDIWEQV